MEKATCHYCDAEFVGDDQEEIIARVDKHLAKKHPDDTPAITWEEES